MANRNLAVEEPESPRRARSLSPTRGRSRSREQGNGRRVSRSASRPSQQVWALNPMVNVEDVALEAAGAEDENFREAVTRARAASQSRGSSPGSGMDRLRGSSPHSGVERLSASSLPRDSSYSGDPLMGKAHSYKLSSSYNGGSPHNHYNGGSPHNHYNGGPHLGSPTQGESPGFFGGRRLKMHNSKPPDMELKLIAQKSEEVVLNIAVQPPTPTPLSHGQSASSSPPLKSVLGKDDLAALKRNSRSATEATTIVPGTQCPDCKNLIPGTFDSGARMTCPNCSKQFTVGERLSLAECQACFTWTVVAKGVTQFKCSLCGQNVELFPMFAGDVPEISRHSASEQLVDQAVHGLLSTWEMIRAGADALLPNPVRTSFVNWSNTIVTDYSVLEPKDDDDIRKLIFEAQAAGLTLRVLGHGHTQSPAVCGNNEPGVLIMRLNRYGQETNGIPDFQWVGGEQGDSFRDVRINAGWSLSQLYAETVPKGYFLFSQTAACPFSIGGFYMNSVHGSAHAESLMSTRCVGLRAIKYDGSIVTIEREKDLRMWRSSFGAGGVITHVTIRMRRFTSIENSHVEFQLEMTPEKVQSCIFDSLGSFHACEFFWDPYTNELIIARWRGNNDGGVSNFEKASKGKHHRGATLTHGLAVGGDAFAKVAPEHCRCFEAREVNLQAAFTGLRHFLKKDASGADTMFIVDWVPRCVFMAYFIPIRSAWDVINALKAVSEVVAWGQQTNQLYGIDCPVEFRFVRGNSTAVFTPLWEPEPADSKEDPTNFSAKQLYMNIEVIAYTKSLDQKFSPYSHQDNPLTASWQEFWYRVEQNWRKIDGAKPHPAKLFGIEPRPAGGYRAFAPQYVHEVWGSKQKKWIRKWLKETDPPQVFTRQFLKHMLAEPSPLDRIDGDDILVHATKLPDATHTTINNINDFKGCWFLMITLPYWLSGMLVHTSGFIMLVVLAILGLFQGQCNESVFGYVIRDCGSHPLCTETALHWIQAWFLFRGVLGLFVAPFHMVINCRRVALCCLKLKSKHSTSWSKPNTDDNSKWFWRCVPICDIMISFTLGFGLICLQHMFECGLSQVFIVESCALGVLLCVLSSRMGMRLRGQYYRFFHYNGNGAFFAQRSITGSWNPFHRLTDRKYL